MTNSQENKVIELLEAGHVVSQVAIILQVSSKHVAAIAKIIGK